MRWLWDAKNFSSWLRSRSPLLNLYYCIFIIKYLLVIFGPWVEGCTAWPIKSDRMAICALYTENCTLHSALHCLLKTAQLTLHCNGLLKNENWIKKNALCTAYTNFKTYTLCRSYQEISDNWCCFHFLLCIRIYPFGRSTKLLSPYFHSWVTFISKACDLIGNYL